MIEIILAPIIAGAIIGTMYRVALGRPMLPESLADAQPYFVAAAAASLLGVVAPTGRIEDVHIAVRVAPLVVFAVLYAAAKATE
jgi:hypothetical protein